MLREMAHIKVNPSIKIDGKDVLYIDMMFENYVPHVSNSLLSKWMTGFSAKLPDKDGYMFFKAGKTTIVSDPPDNYLTLPSDWWEYTTVVYSDGTVKHPTKG